MLNNTMCIPEGTYLGYHCYSTHRDPDIWGSDANQFRPQRGETLGHPGYVAAAQGNRVRLLTGVGGPAWGKGLRCWRSRRGCLMNVQAGPLCPKALPET